MKRITGSGWDERVSNLNVHSCVAHKIIAILIIIITTTISGIFMRAEELVGNSVDGKQIHTTIKEVAEQAQEKYENVPLPLIRE